jgi:uncharacterized protein (DUF433 family)
MGEATWPARRQRPLGRRITRDFDRITLRPGIMGGKACLRGMRVTVGMIVGQIGSGRSIDQLLADCSYLEWEDVLQALRYGASLAEGREFELTTA